VSPAPVIANPQVILADEPTGNLHSAQGKEIMELFPPRSTRGGATIIQVDAFGSERRHMGRASSSWRDGWVVDD